MSAAITTRALGRQYGGRWALRDLDLTVDEGSIFGLLGANGAGKSTTLRILATLLQPSSGRAWVRGVDVRARPTQVRRLIGYMPDSFGVYDDLSVLEYLDFYATAHGVRRSGRRQLLDNLLSIVGISDRRHDFVDLLSRGMKQRLGIARCLVHEPPLLLLDEPASGLDPLSRLEMQTLLRELVRLGKTIVISSHILPELGDLCSHVGIVENGRLLLHGAVRALIDALQAGSPLEVQLAEPAAASAAAGLLRRQPGVAGVEISDGTLHAAVEVGREGELFQLLGQSGYRATRFGRRPATLEDLYFSVAAGGPERSP